MIRCQLKCLILIPILFLAVSLRANAQGCSSVSPTSTGTVTWNPQWCQEFNSTTPAAPDTTVWSFDLGNSGFGNNEIETYCGPPGYASNPSSCSGAFSTATSNAYLDGGGHLVIQAINNGGAWSSARMKTQGLENFQYGRIEASIQLPNTTNQGLWPAFWSLGNDINTNPWPACGETDFMEDWSPQVFNGPGPGGNKTTIHTTATGGNGLGGLFTFASGQRADTAFHTYGTIWSANVMQFYVDDPTKPFLIETPADLAAGDTWPFNANIFLLMNVAVGGTLGGTPSASTPNPGIMMVDYVRQYVPSATVAAPVLGTPPSITVKAGATSGNASTFSPTLATGTGYVYFSCSTNAPKASCAITTTDPLNPHVISASAAESVMVTVTTTANTSEAKAISPRQISPRMRTWLPIAFAGFFLSIVVPSVGRRRRRQTSPYFWALVAGLGLISIITSCGGGNSTTTTTITQGSNGTTPGSYSVTVYAFTESNVSDGSNAKADASVAIPLTVN